MNKDEINNIVRKLFPSGNLLDYMQPLEGSLLDAVQVIPSDQDVFTLKPPVAGLINLPKNNSKLSEKVLLRQLIGYNKLNSFKNEQQVIGHIVPVLQLALNAVMKFRPVTQKVHIFYPMSDDFLREVQEAAAVEFRLFTSDREDS